MTNADPETIYREFHGSLTDTNDPSGVGSQHDVYDYSLVTEPGASLQPLARYNLFIAVQRAQATEFEPASVRPISVNIRTPDKVKAGIVSEPIAIQKLRQAIDPTEWEDAANEADPQGALNRASQTLWLSVGAGSNDANVLVTQELQDQILNLFSGARYATTRANLIAALNRDGSRSEEMFGYQIEYPRDFQRAEEWRQANEPGLPKLIG